ncbi:sugar ABC transporter permease [Aerococcaceae bacterium zg-ZJ1578]|uniref:carbohydrate ABC transporter permease n=1 Tax=Aerococcaceae bacterium zg-252 TaxID=2796928 RepID=UPI001A305BC0|nr:sugar ABC transporter permease [Aerococcaceae bacterium zg-1578]MBR7927540.1 sugar ABC transporter permease [Aerococcaceae bacterium zg-ZUI334]
MKKREYFLFLLPCATAMIVFLLIPLTMGMYYSFTDWNGLFNKWIGFKNYTNLLSDSTFKESLLFTFKFTFFASAIVNMVAISLALLVTRKKSKLNTLFRTFFFMPNLIGGIILGFIWQFIFIRAFSAIAHATGIQLFEGWLSNANTGFWGLIILFVWQMAGYMMVIYISFLNNIPDEVIEAANIDGANGWTKFWKIKVPMIMPAFTICLFLTLSNAFKIYDQNLALTNGGPYNSTQMVSMNIYNEAFQMRNMGYAQAKALVFLIIIILVSAIQLKITSSKETQL